MSQTSNTLATSPTPYVSPQITLLCYEKSIVADLCRPIPNGPPPSYLALCDSFNNPAGQKLYKHLGIGAGEIEAACTTATRYTPADLHNLTGVSQMLMQKLNAARGMWSLAQSLKPLTARPDEVPMARESAEIIAMLKDGVLIFGFLESQSAGLPTVNPAVPGRLITPNVVGYAQRLFPSYQANGLVNRPGRRGCGGGN